MYHDQWSFLVSMMTKSGSLIVRCVAIVGLINVATAAEPIKPSLLPLGEVREVIKKHCVACHGGDETFAGVNLAGLDSELDVWRNRSVWARAQLMIEGGEMPPEEGVALPDDQRRLLALWIQHTLDNVDVSRIPRDPGFVPPRRFTGREYNYTIQDMFGLRAPVYSFPDDLVIGDSFENSADSLRLDALWLEKALDAADATVAAVWAERDALDRLMVLRPSPPPIEDETLFVTDQATSSRCDTSGDFSIVAKVIGFPGRIFLRSPLGADEALGSKEWVLDDERIVYRISRRQALIASSMDLDDGRPHWLGLTVRGGRASLYLDGRLLVSQPRFERPDRPGHLLKIGFREDEDEDEDEEEDEDEDEEEEEEEEEHEDDHEEEDHDRIETFLFYAEALPDEAMLALRKDADVTQLPTATFRWVEGMEPPPDPDFVTVERARDVVLQRFLERAFRQKPARETLDRYVALFQDGLDAGLTFEIALQHPVATALASPEFLFLRDRPAESEQDYPLRSGDLANRLSYFLWSSLPDEELRTVANRDLLTDPELLLEQTDRMLASDKADRFYASFMLQWLKTEGLGDTIRPSRERFPDITDSLLESMRREGPIYFADAVKHDRSLLSLIESPYSLVNAELAAHYGFDGVQGEDWQRVHHDDSSRGGVLTQAAVLTVSSSPQRTSPVFRGKWILEVLLGDPPPPPPPNVPSLPATESATASSLRESLALHRKQAACAGCHSRIDPFGITLEQYDAVGALRRQPQDTRTTLHTGEPLADVTDLKRYLADQKKDEFLRHVTRKMLAYALGRELRFSDERAVHSILENLKKNNMGARSLIHQVVLSEPFRYRRISSTKEEP